MNKAIKTCSFIMPGEFEKQKSVWIVWPHNKKDWPSKFDLIPEVFAEIIFYFFHYAGWPNAVTSGKVLEEVWKEMDDEENSEG